MFSKAIVILAALAGLASAAPVERDGAPASYATGYLEPYSTYHARYLSIGCPSHKSSNDQFFLECCGPMLAGQTMDSTVAAFCVATPAATTTAEAPAATSAAAPSSGVNSGQATFFYQNGNPGACGNYNSDSSSIVALPAQYWPSGGSSPSADCGRQIEIFYGSVSTIATVADLCPSCDGANSIDLSVGAFTALADESLGDISITWEFI